MDLDLSVPLHFPFGPLRKMSMLPVHSPEDMVSDAYSEAWLAGPQSTQFYTRTYRANGYESKAVVVFIHGFVEHVGRYTQVHPVLAAHGFNVFTFDQRGFGKTALDEEHKSALSAYGKTSGEDQLDDIQWAIDHAKKEFPGLPLFLSGHSMGGGEMLNFSVRRDASGLAGVIASSPIIRPTKHSIFEGAALAAGGAIATLFPYTPIPIPMDYNALSHDTIYNNMCKNDVLAKRQGTLRGVVDMLNWGEELLSVNYKKWPNTLPILFVHGTADQITSPEATKEFLNKIIADDKQLILYTDGFHELLQEPADREKLVHDEIAWMDAHLSKAPEWRIAK
ncbi:Hydrolase-4 domain-containing protein [Mycena sanguinolenta]|uniref:Hydrolase-4 domain-containing protein n=1 Tax=Mycena sanguinolenta TaxID=230812 RepID=A0A8H6Y0H9_9AGAR|nr:Hydrolase-4 domain-containing protein [Mycena sanguinolenta]